MWYFPLNFDLPLNSLQKHSRHLIPKALLSPAHSLTLSIFCFLVCLGRNIRPQNLLRHHPASYWGRVLYHRVSLGFLLGSEHQLRCHFFHHHPHPLWEGNGSVREVRVCSPRSIYTFIYLALVMSSYFFTSVFGGYLCVSFSHLQSEVLNHPHIVLFIFLSPQLGDFFYLLNWLFEAFTFVSHWFIS